MEYEDRLFEILEQVSGFPRERDYPHLEAVLADFPGVDHVPEFGRFRDYWREATLARPWLALRAWLQRASGGALPGAKREPVRTFLWRTAPNGMCYTENIVRRTTRFPHAASDGDVSSMPEQTADSAGSLQSGRSAAASPG